MTSDHTTPDDAPIAGDDAIARAARDGLRRLAGSHAPTLDWDGVRFRARRVRQRRALAVVAACAVVIASAGAAVAATVHDPDHVSIAGHGETPKSTTTGPPTTTSTPSTSTTTATPVTSVDSVPSASVPATPAVDARPADLTGTITPATTTWTVGQPVNVALTVHNATDHAVLLGHGIVTVGLYIDFYVNVGFYPPTDVEPTLAAGADRTFTAPMTPGAELIGTTHISAAFVQGIVMDVGGYVTALLPNIAPVQITVIPPGWTSDQALDPAMGKWKVVMSADAREVAFGDSVALHATVTNVGDQTQEAEAYTSLAIVCAGGDWGTEGQRVGLATMAPGDTVTFTVDYWALGEGTNSCWTGITFPDSDGYTESHDGLVSDSVTITVLPEGATTTTTPRATTTVSTP